MAENRSIIFFQLPIPVYIDCFIGSSTKGFLFTICKTENAEICSFCISSAFWRVLVLISVTEFMAKLTEFGQDDVRKMAYLMASYDVYDVKTNKNCFIL